MISFLRGSGVETHFILLQILRHQKNCNVVRLRDSVGHNILFHNADVGNVYLTDSTETM